jgi:hypothetical protein
VELGVGRPLGLSVLLPVTEGDTVALAVTLAVKAVGEGSPVGETEAESCAVKEAVEQAEPVAEGEPEGVWAVVSVGVPEAVALEVCVPEPSALPEALAEPEKVAETVPVRVAVEVRELDPVAPVTLGVLLGVACREAMRVKVTQPLEVLVRLREGEALPVPGRRSVALGCPVAEGSRVALALPVAPPPGEGEAPAVGDCDSEPLSVPLTEGVLLTDCVWETVLHAELEKVAEALREAEAQVVREGVLVALSELVCDVLAQSVGDCVTDSVPVTLCVGLAVLEEDRLVLRLTGALAETRAVGVG